MVRTHAVHNRFEFVTLVSLRVHQLKRGATPRAAPGHKAIVIAQEEVWCGAVTRLPQQA